MLVLGRSLYEIGRTEQADEAMRGFPLLRKMKTRNVVNILALLDAAPPMIRRAVLAALLFEPHRKAIGEDAALSDAPAIAAKVRQYLCDPFHTVAFDGWVPPLPRYPGSPCPMGKGEKPALGILRSATGRILKELGGTSFEQLSSESQRIIRRINAQDVITLVTFGEAGTQIAARTMVKCMPDATPTLVDYCWRIGFGPTWWNCLAVPDLDEFMDVFRELDRRAIARLINTFPQGGSNDAV
jgi:hypothetical protein